jgi:hypothetical protein
MAFVLNIRVVLSGKSGRLLNNFPSNDFSDVSSNNFARCSLRNALFKERKILKSRKIFFFHILDLPQLFEFVYTFFALFNACKYIRPILIQALSQVNVLEIVVITRQQYVIVILFILHIALVIERCTVAYLIVHVLRAFRYRRILTSLGQR